MYVTNNTTEFRSITLVFRPIYVFIIFHWTLWSYFFALRGPKFTKLTVAALRCGKAVHMHCQFIAMHCQLHCLYVRIRKFI